MCHRSASEHHSERFGQCIGETDADSEPAWWLTSMQRARDSINQIRPVCLCSGPRHPRTLRDDGVMHRAALGDFVRTRRERTDPAVLGFSAEARRTPGLRRSEVAELANISEIHYANIEQARGSQPSPDVLAAIGRALRLDESETDHLFELAEEVPPRSPIPNMELSERTRQLIDSLPVPVLVCSARLDVIGQNQAAVELLEDFSALPVLERNLAR